MKDEVSFAVIALASQVLVGILHIVDKKTRTDVSAPKDLRFLSWVKNSLR
jgi:hypothetical protein